MRNFWDLVIEGFEVKIYAGKEDPVNDVNRVVPEDADHLSMSERMVVFLIVTLLDKGYRVHMDNFYSSLRLYLYLRERQTLACGTVNPLRGVPDQLRNQRLAAEQSVALCGDNKIIATMYASTKTVHLLSTAHSRKEERVTNRTRTGFINEPTVAISYNKNMGGVDKTDQLI